MRIPSPAHLLALALGVALVALAQHALPVRTRAQEGDLFIPRPEVARAASLGFGAVMADLYWLRAVQIVGAAHVPEEHGTVLGRLMDVVTTLDPWVDHPYRFAAVWLVGSEADVRHANMLLERSLAYHPDDWRNRFYLGFNLYYYLGEDAAAAEVLETAGAMPGAPAYLGRLAARLRSRSGGLETAAAFLRELARNAPDEYARADYEKALDEIETERRARMLDRAREMHRERAGRDITRVEELASGPGRVLRELPPEPNGWEWVIDEESGRIVSSFYGRRYEARQAPGARRWEERGGEPITTGTEGEA